MSPTDWGICPQCVKNAKEKQARAAESADRAYGKIPKNKYLELLKVAETPVEEEEFRRLGEYYSVGVRLDGKFYVTYSGNCGTCGFSFSYKYDQQVELEDKDENDDDADEDK